MTWAPLARGYHACIRPRWIMLVFSGEYRVYSSVGDDFDLDKLVSLTSRKCPFIQEVSYWTLIH